MPDERPQPPRARPLPPEQGARPSAPRPTTPRPTTPRPAPTAAQPNRGPREQQDPPEWAQKLGGRITPRLRLPKFIRRRLPEVSDDVKQRWGLISGYVQAIALVAFFFAAVAILLSVLTKVSITEPGNAREVMERVDDPKDLAYSVETVRVKNIDGVDVRTDTLRGHQVDLEHNKFRVQVSGLAEDTFRVVGDGKTALYQQGDAAPGVLGSYPPAEQLRPLLPKDLRERAGSLISNRATVLSQRGWLITWHPTKEDILRMLSADLLRTEGPDIDAIRAGDFKIVQRDSQGRGVGVATVLRNSRTLYQANVELEVNGAQLEILVTYRDTDSGNLKDLDLSEQEIEEVT